MAERRLVLYDGKYTWICPGTGEPLRALRYGQPWRTERVGDKALHALFDAAYEAVHDAPSERADDGRQEP